MYNEHGDLVLSLAGLRSTVGARRDPVLLAQSHWQAGVNEADGSTAAAVCCTSEAVENDGQSGPTDVLGG